MTPLPWLCRNNQHAWRTVAVSAVRTVGPDRLGSVTERCERPGCQAQRHEQNVVLAGVIR